MVSFDFPPSTGLVGGGNPRDLQDVEIHAVPAGVLAQTGAWLVDAAVLATFFGVYLLLAQEIAGGLPPSPETGIDWVIDRALAWKGVVVPGLLLAAALSFVYSSLFHSLGGRTLGKRLFGLTLVDATGMPPPLTLCAARAGLAYLSAAVLMMGFLVLLFDRRRQALHDKLTHTFVVRLAE